MISLFNNMYAVLPEITLLITATLAILAELFLDKKIKCIALYISLIGLFASFLISVSLLNNFKIVTLGGLFISDDMGQLMNMVICLCVFLCFVYSKDYIDEREMPSGDYYILGLFSTIGMLVLVGAHSLVSVYLGLELLSLPLYAMVAIQRTNSNAAEASMKYFVMGAIASGMMLFGFSLLFGATGKLDLMEIANVIAANSQQENLLLSFALVFIVSGIGFKLAAVPFHMWAPDVYDGAPTSVTLFISSAPKIAAFGMAFRLLTIGLIDISAYWQQLLLVMALLSTIIGNVLAVAQTNLKRLFAYSAIAHIGYALFGIACATTAGFAASLYYILVYALMTAAAFGLLILLSKGSINVEYIDDLKGLNKRNPWLALLMMITLFSMAGVPPTVGFFTKLLVLKALVDIHLTWIATVALLFAVIGAYYYIKIIKVMYFDELPLITEQDDKIPAFPLICYSLNGLALLYFGIFPTGLLTLCLNAFK